MMHKNCCTCRAALSIILVAAILFAGCKKNTQNTYTRLCGIMSSYSEMLPSVSVYYSRAEEGETTHIDTGMISAMLGDGKEYPTEMSGCAEYAFFCASGVYLCEVWVIECRTHTSARAVFSLFEKRQKRIMSLEYESDTDTSAANNATLVRDGRYVYFAVSTYAGQITDDLQKRV